MTMPRVPFVAVLVFLPLSAAFAADPAGGPAKPAERVLEWRDDKPVAYPRLFIEPGTADAFRQRLKADKPRYEFCTTRPDGHPHAAALRYIATGEDDAARAMMGLIDRLEKAADGKTDGPDFQTLVSDIAAADWLLSWKRLPPERETRLRRALAAVGYALDRTDAEWRDTAGAHFWSSTALRMIAELLPTHPARALWIWNSSIGDGVFAFAFAGDWLARHPAVAVPTIVREAVVLRANPSARPPKGLLERLDRAARVSTPFDPVRGARTGFGPPDSPLGRGTYVFGWAAGAFARSDPEFAGEMAWWHRQFGGTFEAEGRDFFGVPAIGVQLLDAAPRPRVPRLPSGVVPGFGVVVREDAPSPGELYLAAERTDDPGKTVSVSYFQGAFPAAWIDIEAYLVGMGAAAGPRPPPPTVTHALTSMRFAELVSLRRDADEARLLLIKSPVQTAPQYLVMRSRYGKSDRLLLALPGDKTSSGDGAASASFEALGSAVDVRLLTKTNPPKTKALEPLGRGMPWSSFEFGFPDAAGEVAAVVFPYDLGIPRPKITPLAEGAGAQVEYRGSTHWVFLSGKEVHWTGETAEFEGTAGAVREAPAVTGVQVFGGGYARCRGFAVRTDGTLSLLQSGFTTLQIETDGPAQKVVLTWKRGLVNAPEIVLDDKPLACKIEDNVVTFTVPEGKHKGRIDFDR
jgi:hypothetical protein